MKSQVQTARIQKIIKSECGSKVRIGDIISKYEQLHGKKPTYEGKFKSYIESIPGIEVKDAGNGYVKFKWVGESSNNSTTTLPQKLFECKVCGITTPMGEKTYKAHIEGKKHKQKVTSSTNPLVDKNHDEKETTTTTSISGGKKHKVKDEVKIAVHDSAADIITFRESVGG